jgi:hypothetical protein
VSGSTDVHGRRARHQRLATPAAPGNAWWVVLPRAAAFWLVAGVLVPLFFAAVCSTP